MKVAPLITLLLLPLTVLLSSPTTAQAAEKLLKVDKTRSFIDVDVKSTVKNFTAHLDNYESRVTADDAGKIKSAVLTFKFTDLSTGDSGRNADMIKWLGGGVPEGRFELGILALTPDGQGQVTGKLILHGQTNRIEFSVNLVRTGDTYTVTGEAEIDYTDWGLPVIKRSYLLKVAPTLKVRMKLTIAPVDTSSLLAN